MFNKEKFHRPESYFMLLQSAFFIFMIITHFLDFSWIGLILSIISIFLNVIYIQFRKDPSFEESKKSYHNLLTLVSICLFPISFLNFKFHTELELNCIFFTISALTYLKFHKKSFTTLYW